MNATLNGQKWSIVECFSCGGKGTMERAFLGDRKDLPPRPHRVLLPCKTCAGKGTLRSFRTDK